MVAGADDGDLRARPDAAGVEGPVDGVGQRQRPGGLVDAEVVGQRVEHVAGGELHELRIAAVQPRGAGGRDHPDPLTSGPQVDSGAQPVAAGRALGARAAADVLLDGDAGADLEPERLGVLGGQVVDAADRVVTEHRGRLEPPLVQHHIGAADGGGLDAQPAHRGRENQLPDLGVAGPVTDGGANQQIVHRRKSPRFFGATRASACCLAFSTSSFSWLQMP